MNEKRQKGLPMYPGAKKLYTFLTICIIGETIATIAQAYFLARAITHLFARTPLDDVIIYIGLFFIAFIIRYILSHIETALAENHALQTTKHLRETLFHTYFHTPNIAQKIGTGHFVTLVMEGVDDVKTYIEIIGIRMIRSVILPASIVIFVFFFDKKSSFILVGAVPVIVIFMILLGLAAEKLADKQYVTYKRLSNHFLDSLRGLQTLTYLGKAKQHSKQINKVSNDYRKATNRTLRVAFLSTFALDFFTSLSIAFVAVGLGLRLIDGTVAFLPALTILILAPEYFAPIKQVGKDYHATLDGQVAMAEINTLTKAAPEDETENDTHIEPWTNNATLTLHNISVQVDDTNILQAIDITAKAGFIGIIGTSGAGKTTLLQLLAGQIEHTEGNIALNGRPIDTLNDPTWTEQMAYIPQRPYIFPLSVADNIRFYEPSATDEQVTNMIDKIGLTDFIESLPNGIHEKIGEGGRTVSGGQEQRIAIARALLSDKQIILLDEPTAHVDIETEYEIKQLITELFTDKLVLLATHRLHWLRSMDTIYLLQNGKIVANGTHDTLNGQNEAYDNFTQIKRGERHA